MRLRVLIFDDDPLIRKLLWTVCDQRGCEVFTFPEPGLCPLPGGDRCRCSAKKPCTDIILSDLNMPGVKGLDFVEGLLERGCLCRHIGLMSSQWSEQDIARAFRLGCTLLQKPFDVGRIESWLDEVERSLSPSRELADWHWGGNGGHPTAAHP